MEFRSESFRVQLRAVCMFEKGHMEDIDSNSGSNRALIAAVTAEESTGALGRTRARLEQLLRAKGIPTRGSGGTGFSPHVTLGSECCHGLETDRDAGKLVGWNLEWHELLTLNLCRHNSTQSDGFYHIE